MEVSRDAVIAFYQAKGAGHRLLSDDVVGSKKTVIASTVEQTNRLKTGIELEKSVFLDRYSENPEVLKKSEVFRGSGTRRGHRQVEGGTTRQDP